MPTPRSLLRSLAAMVFKGKADRDLDKEIKLHLALETEKNIEAGYPSGEARRLARVTFGPVEAMKEAHRDGRGARWLDHLMMDARFAVRQMKRAPVFTVIAVIVLALGMGVNSALIAFVDSALNPPVVGLDRADQIVRISFEGTRTPMPGGGWRIAPTSFPGLDAFHARQTVLARTAQFDTKPLLISANDVSSAETGVFVTRDYFDVLRPRMTLGTALPVPAADAETPAVAVLSHRFWVVRMGADSGVISRTIRINDHAIPVVGVMPEGFRNNGSVWMAYSARQVVFDTDSAYRRTSGRGSGMIGRLRDGVSRREAGAQLSALFTSYGAAESRVGNLYEMGTPQQIAGVAAFFGVITAMILAIACANVSVLLLGKAVGRRREIAMRLSLGAGRGRVIRQLLTESALLAVIAGCAGLLVLRWSSGLISTTFTEAAPQLSPRWTTIGLTIAIAAGTGLFFGLLPALHATRANLADVIKDSLAGVDRHRARLQRAFVVAEVALSMSLVCATGLLVQAVQNQSGAESSAFNVSDDVFVTDFDFALTKYPATRVDELMTAVRERVATLPGVNTAAFSTGTPLGGCCAAYGRLAGDTATDGQRSRMMVFAVDHGSFGALSIPIDRGRPIEASDVSGAPPVAVVAASVAARLWPGENPIGRTLEFAPATGRQPPQPLAAHPWTVVGIARDVGRDFYGQNLPNNVYLSRRQLSQAVSSQLIVHVPNAVPEFRERLREVFRATAPDVPQSPIRTTREMFNEQYAEVHEVGLGASLAGAFALALACVGVYAVIAFGVAQREREIGIRIALGAARAQVVGMFFRDGMRLVLIGFAIGVPLAIAGMKLLGSEMYGLTMVTPRPVVTIVAVLLGVAALASWLPARRATRVDPIDSLRNE